MKETNVKTEQNYSSAWYRNAIIEMVKEKDLDIKFLRQIYMIMKIHIEKRKRGH